MFLRNNKNSVVIFGARMMVPLGFLHKTDTMKKTLSSFLLLLSVLSASAQGKVPFYDRGYAGNVELGCLIKSYPYATLSTTHGYCLGKGWFVGIGGMFESGLYPRTMQIESRNDFYEGDMMVKLFLDLRKTIKIPCVNMFVDVKAGSPRDLARPESRWGSFVRPTLGVVFPRHLALSAGLDWTTGFFIGGSCTPGMSTLPYIGISYQF